MRDHHDFSTLEARRNPYVPPVGLVYSEAMKAYDFGGAHPLNARRLQLTIDRIQALGLLDDPANAVLAPPRLATWDELITQHDAEYLEALKRAGKTGRPEPAHGLGHGDNPVFPDMLAIAALAAGGSILAVEKVMDGEWRHAFAIGGGLHHAQRDHASGFCLLNDPALAIQAALDGGVERVVYVDIDVHHGDGVQALFYADPRVLTISLHQSGRTLYPGTGFVDEMGTGEARGTSVNIAFPPQTGDDVFLDTIERVVVPLTTAFAPDLLVTQNGCDMHIEDPLANLLVTLEGYATAVRRLHRLAHDVCDGRLVALGGGGYAIDTVVPFAWSALFADLVDAPPPELRAEQVPPQTPVLRDQIRYTVDKQIERLHRDVFPIHGAPTS